MTTAERIPASKASYPLCLFLPSGHFPLIGGIDPWKGSLGVCTYIYWYFLRFASRKMMEMRVAFS